MGCTEPISLAYAAAVAAKYMDGLPDKVLVEASGSIIKNVKSVIVPNTNHMKGIPVAAAVGIIAGNPDKELEVLADVTPEQIANAGVFAAYRNYHQTYRDLAAPLTLSLPCIRANTMLKCALTNDHTNVVLIEKDGENLNTFPLTAKPTKALPTEPCLTWPIFMILPTP